MLLLTRAIVTGGSSGIGAALVNLLLKAGVEVISLSRTEADFSGQEQIENLWQIPCDISNEEQLAAVFEKISE